MPWWSAVIKWSAVINKSQPRCWSRAPGTLVSGYWVPGFLLLAIELVQAGLEAVRGPCRPIYLYKRINRTGAGRRLLRAKQMELKQLD